MERAARFKRPLSIRDKVPGVSYTGASPSSGAKRATLHMKMIKNSFLKETVSQFTFEGFPTAWRE